MKPIAILLDKLLDYSFRANGLNEFERYLLVRYESRFESLFWKVLALCNLETA